MPTKSARLAVLWAGRLVPAVLLAAGASGCLLPSKMTGTSALAVAPDSQVARDVDYAQHHPGPYPKFTDIPALPTDVPPSSQYRSAVLAMQQQRTLLEQQAGALPAPPNDTEAQAGGLHSRLPEQAQAPPAESQQQTEAYGRALRERAIPPPPPK